MLKVRTLSLPKILPHPATMKSFNGSENNYDPEFWEFQYEIYRYLEKAPDGVVVTRYVDLLRNMNALVSRERDMIPIQSFLSSWYWYRKEHQTRLEFYLRGMELPVEPPYEMIFNNEAHGAPYRPKHPNSGDILYRYDKTTYLENTRLHGIVRVRPASDYSGLEFDAARQDEELSKKSFLSGRHTKITLTDGRIIPVIGDVQQTYSGSNYYVYCMSCDWDYKLFDDFGGSDGCMVISNVNKFSCLLEKAGREKLGGWSFHHNPVQYFDPYERVKNEYFDARMTKDFKYAYQREYRFIWYSPGGEQAEGFKFLEMGGLEDIVSIYGRSD